MKLKTYINEGNSWSDPLPRREGLKLEKLSELLSRPLPKDFLSSLETGVREKELHLEGGAPQLHSKGLEPI